MICDLDQAAADSNTMWPTLASLSALSALGFGAYNYDRRLLPLDNLLSFCMRVSGMWKSMYSLQVSSISEIQANFPKRPSLTLTPTLLPRPGEITAAN